VSAVPELLLRLLGAAGPPGAEREPVGLWREAADGFAAVTTDAMGTPAARVDGIEDGPLLAIVGHIDEIALLVSHVTDDGFLRVVASGGWDPQILVGQRVKVLTAGGPLPGVVGRKPTHLLRDEERKKAVELKQLHVDVGARDADEARGLVRVGDPLVVAADPVELPNGRLTSRSLDNRLGAYVALEVARRVADAGGAAGPVVAVAAVQEEIGALGAGPAAFALRPDLAIVVDVTHATDAPGVEPDEIGSHPLGSGPAITRGAIPHPRIFELLREVAEAEAIGYTVEPAGRHTFTDADVIHLSRAGVPTGVVSIPLRYMHSPVELVELGDVEAVVRLLTAFAHGLDSGAALSRW
jgi:putative aminopeptidase FrvX